MPDMVGRSEHPYVRLHVSTVGETEVQLPYLTAYS
jgi:hypothetical protein